MNAPHQENVDTTRLREQAERYSALVTLLSKLVLALLFASLFIATRYWP